MNVLFKRALACVMTVSVLAAAPAAFADFSDMPAAAEEKTALENAVNNGLLTGYDTGEIKPYDPITRAQMAAIIVRAMGAEATADISKFSDVKPEHWYYDAMSKAVAMEAFQGDGRNLNPEINITYQEAFAVVARVFELMSERDLDKYRLSAKLIDKLPEYTTDALDSYTDKDKIAQWAIPTTRAVVENGYWTGKNSQLRPTEYITRVDFATLMNNIVTTYIDEPGEYRDLPTGNVMIRSSNVTIGGLSGSNIDVFTGDSVKENVVLDDVKIKRLIMRGGKVLVKEPGEYQLIRMIGHNCLVDYSERPKVSIQISAKYPADSKVNIGIKEID
ncbi:MAG: S-layer homology domain-containing protein [Clostridia bacterium]|nr:S-layer homology domain-containing protein [Clostridia bacterium]